jgi:hypothetical protein
MEISWILVVPSRLTVSLACLFMKAEAAVVRERRQTWGTFDREESYLPHVYTHTYAWNVIQVHMKGRESDNFIRKLKRITR